MDLVPENVHAEGAFVAFRGSLHLGGLLQALQGSLWGPGEPAW